ncbi:dTMP kinase [Candidatus Bathyarchaeota archaeon]|nr:dTMP kinase [Candidatus Bathyarchaeota archaeon]
MSNRYISKDMKFGSSVSLLGQIIALEGIDQAGKNTQARLLAQHLKRIGSKAAIISFPVYSSPSGQQILRYLKGKRNYPPEALHMLYSVNRWENKARIDDLVRKNHFVIADRYTPSNFAYGVSNGLRLKWLQGLDEGLPLPRLVILLDVPPHASIARKSQGRDVHERDQRFLASVRRSYKVLAHKLGWEIVDAARPVNDVHAIVWQIVQHRFKVAR